MSREQLVGTAIVLGGLTAFGALLARRSRAVRRGRGGRTEARALRGGLRLFQALASPSGEWVAVVRAGPPFDSRLDSAIESTLWFLFWLVPAPLSRIEIALHAAGRLRPGVTPEEIGPLLDAPPALVKVIWRGAGSPERAREVQLAWSGPSKLLAAFRGTTHTVEAPPPG